MTLSTHFAATCVMLPGSYTVTNTQVATSLLTSCNNLLQQADIRMRLHGLRQLVGEKSVASCQQTYIDEDVKGAEGNHTNMDIDESDTRSDKRQFTRFR